MESTSPNQSPADALREMIAAGVARYQESLPDFARETAPIIRLPDFALDVEPTARVIAEASAEPTPEAAVPRITLRVDLQRELCLSCPLADCIGIENEDCPLRIEQRATWRRRKEAGR